MSAPRTILLCVALVASACSSGDDSSASTTVPPVTPATTAAPASTPATTSPPATAPPAPTTEAPVTTEAPAPTTAAGAEPELTDAQLADRDTAQGALITLDVFPEGWSEEPDDDDDGGDTDDLEAEFDACLGRTADDRIGDDLEPLTAKTGDFNAPADSSTSVSHEVVLAPDEATAVTAMSEVAVDGAEPCLASAIQVFYTETFAADPGTFEGITLGDVSVTRTQLDLPDDVEVGFLLEIPLTVDDETASQFLEVLYQRDGRALSELSFSSFGASFDREGFAVLRDEAASRLSDIAG